MKKISIIVNLLLLAGAGAINFCEEVTQTVGTDGVEVTTAGFPALVPKQGCACAVTATTTLSNTTTLNIMVEVMMDRKDGEDECSPFVLLQNPDSYQYMCAGYSQPGKYSDKVELPTDQMAELILVNDNWRKLKAKFTITGEYDVQLSCGISSKSIQVAGCPCSERAPKPQPGDSPHKIITEKNDDGKKAMLIGFLVVIGILIAIIILCAIHCYYQTKSSSKDLGGVARWEEGNGPKTVSGGETGYDNPTFKTSQDSVNKGAGVQKY